MMYTKKPNHIGILVGEVINYNINKGHTKIKLYDELNLGDSIAIGEATCKISELMQQNENIKSAAKGQMVTIGRIKGKISKGDKVYKTVSVKLNQEINQKLIKENIKRDIKANISLKQNQKPVLKLQDILTGIETVVYGEKEAEKAINNGITKQRIEEQISKTGNTVFRVKSIDLQMDENIIIPISSLNEIRRKGLEALEEKILESFKRKFKTIQLELAKNKTEETDSKKVILCLNKVCKDIDYSKITGVDGIYIPFKYFLNKELEYTIKTILNKFDTYVLLPAITKSNYKKLLINNLYEIAQKVNGIIISNLSHIRHATRLKYKQ